MPNPIRLILLVALAFTSLAVTAAEAPRYSVGVRVLHLGQVLAAPLMVIEEDQAVAATYQVPGEAHWRYVAKVSPATASQVNLSLEFNSGNIEVQPNLLVELGEPFSTVVDDKVLIEGIVALADPSTCLTGDEDCTPP